MFQANLRGYARLAAGLLLAPGLTIIGTEYLHLLSPSHAQEVRPADAGSEDSIDQAERLMKQARAEFDRGHYDQAADLARKVKAMKVAMPFFRETPEQLLAEIAEKTGKKGTVSVAAPAMPAKATKEDPRVLIKKGRDALEVNHLEEAMKFARQADFNGKNASWGLFEDSPSSLLKDVQKAQAKHNRVEADRMLNQARGLYEKKAHNDTERAGFLDKARQLAKQSETLHGEYSMWDLGDRPGTLIKEIDSARTKLKTAVVKKTPTRPDLDPHAVVSNLAGTRTQNPSPYKPSDANAQTVSKKPLPMGGVPSPLDPPPALNNPMKDVVVAKAETLLPNPDEKLILPDETVKPASAIADLVLPDSIVKPTETAPKANPQKAQAMQLMQQARAAQQAERYAEAKELLLAAQKQNVVFTIDEETPETALQALNGAALKKMQVLCREAHECIGKKELQSLTEGERKLNDAEAIALAMALDASAIREHRSMLVTARTSLTTGSSAPRTVAAPTPETSLVLPGVAPATPSTAAVQAEPMVQPTAAPTDPGKAMLAQAQVELRAQQMDSARKIVTQVLNGPYTCKKEAEDLLRTIDAEEFVQRQRTARRAYENAIFAYQQQNFEQALAVFRQVDATLLDPNQRTALNELMGSAAKVVAAKQAPAGKVVRAGGTEPGLSMNPGKPTMPSALPDPMETRTGADSLLKQQEAMQQIAFQKLRSEGLKVESDASARFGKGETDEALRDLQNFIVKVKQADLDPGKVALLTRPIETRAERLKVLKHQTDFLTKESRDLRAFKSNMSQEALTQQHKQEQVAGMVKEYNKLIAERKFQEANKVAMQASELDPDNPVPQALMQMSQLMYRKEMVDKGHKENESTTFWGIQEAMELGATATGKDPVQFDKDVWKRIANRKDYSNGLGSMRNRSTKEKEIESTMERSMLNFDFKGTPLNEVVRYLQVSTRINVVLDEEALNRQNIPLNKPVNLTLNNICMKSAVNVIVGQVGLNYVIENDVLKITTHDRTRGKLMQKTIPVADLVVPVRNYGLPSVYDFEKALEKSGDNKPKLGGQLPYTPANGLRNGTLASPNGSLSSMTSPGSSPGGRLVNTSATEKESDQGTIEQSLIRLITNSVRPDTWASVGGSGTIEYYPLGMALVINQTPDVVGDVEVLLEQLRRLQDLEIAVEIRVISLSDMFYERIGVDFSMNIATKNRPGVENAIITGNFAPSTVANSLYRGITGAVIGLQAPGVPTPDLNVPIAPSSFSRAVPPFGGYSNDPGTNGGLSLGLSFLNDIQVSMFLEAAQGDQRTNIMQAPKLTLFNGGTSSINVNDIHYFLTNISAVSVNGQLVFQPQNDPFPLGTRMTLQAVATGDRRFVRLGIAQNMTTLSSATVQLFPITTFITPTFEGGFQGQPIPFTQYVQQPQFATIFVQTTVVVPDGGTVMIGGMKTLSEGRNEFGPPVLSKIPYVNRLFKNVGYGREARSMLMMVTPRIIINREEERKQTGIGYDDEEQR